MRQKGLAPILIILIIATVGIFGWIAYTNSFDKSKNVTTTPSVVSNGYQPESNEPNVEKTSLYYDEGDFLIYTDVRSLAAALELCAADNGGVYSAEDCSSIDMLKNKSYLGSFFKNREINFKVDRVSNLYITYATLNNYKILCENKSNDSNYGNIRYAVHRSITNKTSIECLKEAPMF